MCHYGWEESRSRAGERQAGGAQICAQQGPRLLPCCLLQEKDREAAGHGSSGKSWARQEEGRFLAGALFGAAGGSRVPLWALFLLCPSHLPNAALAVQSPWLGRLTLNRGCLPPPEPLILCSALFPAVTGSAEGGRALWRNPAVLKVLAGWALSADPILQRCGVGALAKLVQSGERPWLGPPLSSALLLPFSC